MAQDKVKADELLYQIITDRRCLSATDGTGNTVDLMVRSLNPLERIQADFIYQKAYRKAKRLKLLSEKQCMADAIQKGLWTKDKEKLIGLYKAEIKQLEKQRNLYAQSTNKGKQIKFRNDIIKARKKLEKLQAEHESFTQHSLEGHANQVRANYVLSRMVLCGEAAHLWCTYNDFLDEKDSKFIASIVHAVNMLVFTSEENIRMVARHPMWSIMWGAAKTSGDRLFSRASTEYTNEQSLLCYWAMMYDSVYESMEKPPDSVIEDDEALDKWFEAQKDKREKDRKKSRAESGGDIFHGHSSTGASQQEQFIMVKTEEDADDVYDLNDKWSLAQIRSETKKIEDSPGEVQEYDLRRNRIKKQLMMENSGKFAEARRTQARGSSWLG